jgi:hypothetical protein
MKIYMHTALQDDEIIEGNLFSKFSFFEYLRKPSGVINILKYGISGRSLFGRLRNPEYLHMLYVSKDAGYLKYLQEFKDRYSSYDVIVMNPGVDLVHPEFLHKNFKNSLKILHFIDDPHTTYSYGLPFSWAFDAATYITPSYSEDYSMAEILKCSGFNDVKWVPHCVTNLNQPKWSQQELESQLYNRNGKAIYVGSYYSGKQDRLSKLKLAFGNKLDIYGYYPLGGYSFGVFSCLSGIPSMYRVKTISDNYREAIYDEYAVGINLHLSTPSLETGNARLYELAYRGVAQVVDTSPVSRVGEIFEPTKEILTYENIDECVEKVNMLLNDKDLRISLALNAYSKACKNYQYRNCLNDLTQWFSTLLLKKINL